MKINKKTIFVVITILLFSIYMFCFYKIAQKQKINEELIPKATVIEHKVPIINNDDLEVKNNNYEEFNLFIETQSKLIQEEIRELNTTDKKEWFIGYKQIIKDNLEILDPPETIYDYFTEDELNLLFSVVEAEATAGSFIEKANVASVIFNRLGCEKWGCNINDILTESQFHVIKDGRYKKVEITEDTILACEFVFCIGDTTEGALYFESENSDVHNNYATYMFTDEIGHKFYQ